MRIGKKKENASFAAKLQNEEMVGVSMYQVENSEKRLERMEEDMRKSQGARHDDMLRRENEPILRTLRCLCFVRGT